MREWQIQFPLAVNYVSMVIQIPHPNAHRHVYKGGVIIHSCFLTDVYHRDVDFNAVDWVWFISLSHPPQLKSAPPSSFRSRATWPVWIWTLWSLSPLARGVTSPARKATTWPERTHSPVWPRDNGATRPLHAQVGHRNHARAPWKQHKLPALMSDGVSSPSP